MKYSATEIGKAIQHARKDLGITQAQLALTSGTGLRFIVDLERGKPSCQLEKTLTVLRTLNIELQLILPNGIDFAQTRGATG